MNTLRNEAVEYQTRINHECWRNYELVDLIVRCVLVAFVLVMAIGFSLHLL